MPLNYYIPSYARHVSNPKAIRPLYLQPRPDPRELTIIMQFMVNSTQYEDTIG